MNIVATIRQETAPHLAKTAIIESDRTITYRDLLAQITSLSQTLTAHNIGPGNRIAFRCKDGIDYIIGALALLDCGAAVVPIPDAVTETEVQETLTRIDVHATLQHTDFPPPPNSPTPLSEIFHLIPRTAASTFDQPCRNLHAAFIRFSSGTTGASKGVLLSHQSILERTTAANSALAVTHQDVILWVLGMSHHFVVSILLFLRQAATIVVGNRNFPFSVLDAATRHPITLIYGSPVHYYLLAGSNAVAPTALAHVRLAISTAMKMPPEICEKFTHKFNFSPREAYGIIEIGLPFINTDPGTAGQHTVGRVLPAYQLQIANQDSDGVGDVLIQGPGMFDAYFSPWQTRSESLTHGFFHTGDLGRLDDHGRLALVGRTKTVIVSAGMKVFPEEVEEVINTHPGIQASLVSGRPHPQFGQIPVVQLLLKPSADPTSTLADLRAHCFRKLSSYKVPLTFTIVTTLPHTPSGKLARAQSS